MKSRTKSILLLSGSFVTGTLLGALLVGALFVNRVQRVQELRQPPRLAEHFETTIAPTPEQRQAVRDVLADAAPAAIEIMDEARREMRALNDSVLTELRPILTEEQLARLQERMRLGGPGPGAPLRGPMHRWMRPSGPPPRADSLPRPQRLF
ncbi:MAG: hypothetical protein GVY18_06445 [Bacteroidetes bacterium]|jgi:uncharacterized membrane protein|nr:hypothetical protein [Bacteroidota bacterium]